MLTLNPVRVELGDRTLEEISLLTVERVAVEPLREWTDGGPYAVFADAPKVRTAITIRQRMPRDDADPIRLGERSLLRWTRTLDATQAQATAWRASVVVMSVRFEHREGRVERVIEAEAVSDDPTIDPLSALPA
jgi:hypothetical protein